MISMIRRHFVIIIITASVIVLLGSATYFSLYAMNHESIIREIDKKPNHSNQGNNTDHQDGNVIIETSEDVRKIETGLLLGVDNTGSLTDVIMLFYLDVEEREIKIISVPRDIKMDFRKKEFRQLKQNNPSNNVLYCKLNEVYGYTGRGERGVQDLKSVVEILTGIDINYYTIVDLDLLNQVVDAIGGVWFDVPQDMRYYDDYQNLKINLQKGYQLLDGKKAEQLVRFRRYEWGDLQRVEVQRDFVTVLAKEVVESSTLLELSDLATIAYNGMETDIPFSAVLNYSTCFYNNRTYDIFSNAETLTIPSFPEEYKGGQYFQLYDPEDVLESIRGLLEK